MSFSHFGSFTRVPYLYILEKQHKSHPNSANIFWPLRDVCKIQNASAISRMRKKFNEIIILWILQNSKNVACIA